jgi:hypothetical protein
MGLQHWLNSYVPPGARVISVILTPDGFMIVLDNFPNTVR